jgi:phage terminase large subunit GpA-like protein
VVEVFRAFEGGKLRQVGLSAEQVRRLRPESAGPGWTIDSEAVPVPEAAGIVRTWPSGRDHVHWHCPRCSGEHISDFDTHAFGNPVLWFCEHGQGLCLVHWERRAAEPGAAADQRRQSGSAG